MARITPYKAPPLLAAMSQKAAALLQGRNMAAAPGGGAVQMAAPAAYPSSFMGQRQAQLGGGQTRMNAAMNAALMRPTMQAPSRSEIYAAAAARAAQAGVGGGGDPFSQADFERGNLQFAGQLGMSGEDALAAAQAHAPSYGGVQFRPHNIAQEGSVTYRNGVPGIMVKYSAPGQGSSTEWVPLG